METNVIVEYCKYIKLELLTFYRNVLGKKYNKKIIEPLIDQYILVRYYNETNYPKENDFVERISRELKTLIKPYLGSEEEELVKCVYALFGYLFYFDDCYYVEDEKSLLEVFFQDTNIKIDFSDEIILEVRKLLKRFKKNKDSFHEVFVSKQFNLEERRIKRNLYTLKLGQNVKISNLYSEYAIDRAFNTGVVNEDKFFILLLMTSCKLLDSAIALDFSRFYLISFPKSLFAKEKKIERGFSVIDNVLAKKYILINIYYEDYIQYRDKIDEKIKQGFSFSLTINNVFDEDYSKFILFSNIIVYEDSEFYDMIINNKGSISSQVIVL